MSWLGGLDLFHLTSDQMLSIGIVAAAVVGLVVVIGWIERTVE